MTGTDRADFGQGWLDASLGKPVNWHVALAAPQYQVGYQAGLRDYALDVMRCAPVVPQSWPGFRHHITEQALTSLNRHRSEADASEEQ